MRSTFGWEAISLPTRTFWIFPPLILLTGNSVLGVTTSRSSHIFLANFSGSFLLKKMDLPFLQDLNIMLLVIPMEPTRPIPSLSSGTKAIPTPSCLIFIGARPTSSFLSPLFGSIYSMEPDLMGYRPVMHSKSSFCPLPAMAATPRISPEFAVKETLSSLVMPSPSTQVRPFISILGSGLGYLGLSIFKVTAWPTIISVSF